MEYFWRISSKSRGPLCYVMYEQKKTKQKGSFISKEFVRLPLSIKKETNCTCQRARSLLYGKPSNRIFFEGTLVGWIRVFIQVFRCCCWMCCLLRELYGWPPDVWDISVIFLMVCVENMEWLGQWSWNVLTRRWFDFYFNTRLVGGRDVEWWMEYGF